MVWVCLACGIACLILVCRILWLGLLVALIVVLLVWYVYFGLWVLGFDLRVQVTFGVVCFVLCLNVVVGVVCLCMGLFVWVCGCVWFVLGFGVCVGFWFCVWFVGLGFRLFLFEVCVRCVLWVLLHGFG